MSPRPVFIPVDPGGLAEWDGSSVRSRRSGDTSDDGESRKTLGVMRQPKHTPVLVNGSLTPTSWLEALMQSTPGHDAIGSTEELMELAHAIEFEMQALLTDRERFVVEAIIFEGLSLRDIARRWNGAWGKTQVARIRDEAYRKLGTSDRLRGLAGLGRDSEAATPEGAGSHGPAPVGKVSK